MGSPTFQATLPVPLMEPLHSPSKRNLAYQVRCLHQCADSLDAVWVCGCGWVVWIGVRIRTCVGVHKCVGVQWHVWMCSWVCSWVYVHVADNEGGKGEVG